MAAAFSFKDIQFPFGLTPQQEQSLQTADRRLSEYGDLVTTVASLGKHVVIARPELDALIDLFDGLLPSNQKELLCKEVIITCDGNGDEKFDVNKITELSQKEGDSDLKSAACNFTLRNRLLGVLYDSIIPCLKKIVVTQNQTFSAERNGDYWLCDSNGLPIKLTALDNESELSFFNKKYDKKSLTPFISGTRKNETPEQAEKRREGLYKSLNCRVFIPADIKSICDKNLLGENAVFAEREIEQGELLGVYSGIGLNREQLGLVFDDTYFAGIGLNESSPFDIIDGTNVLSRINTVYVFKDGLPVCCDSDPNQYNVDVTNFECSTNLDKKPNLLLRAYYAAKDIPKGTELRVFYGNQQDMFVQLQEKFKAKGQGAGTSG